MKTHYVHFLFNNTLSDDCIVCWRGSSDEWDPFSGHITSSICSSIEGVAEYLADIQEDYWCMLNVDVYEKVLSSTYAHLGHRSLRLSVGRELHLGEGSNVETFFWAVVDP